jgi:hypothetical protein
MRIRSLVLFASADLAADAQIHVAHRCHMLATWKLADGSRTL